ncbi:hypothetical protein [Scytonema sp. NUACC26]|uniref:hypothetical protein n=1 Tax=Scytonema sp. NUACC26 TaxID=3140176 RepID=UPI0034DBDCB5
MTYTPPKLLTFEEFVAEYGNNPRYLVEEMQVVSILMPVRAFPLMVAMTLDLLVVFSMMSTRLA